MKHFNAACLALILFFSCTIMADAQSLKAWLSAGDKSMENYRYAEAIEYDKKALEF